MTGKAIYGTVYDAFKAAGLNYDIDDPNALLVWWDSVKESDYYSSLKPFQIVNRIPAVNNICRKAPFVRLIQRIRGFFPTLYSFLPQSYVLPYENHAFMKAVSQHDRKHIVKPDNGSLGAGIRIIEPGDLYTPTSSLSIAQEYVESCLVDATKFDCRIYALVASVSPLKIFVYRGGVARFCSQETCENSVYSQLTNTAVNRNNPDADLTKITRMVPDVFDVLKSRGVNTQRLWQRIDSAIVLTIIAGYGYISVNLGETNLCPPCVYPRCFQILGFDILIDENYNPVVLEVNYRPSLESDTDEERKMKVEMLSSAMSIVAPLNCVQQALNSSKESFKDATEWKAFVNRNPTLVREIHENLAAASDNSHFVKVFPSVHPDYDKWISVMEKVKTMPTDYERQSRMPVPVIPPNGSHPLNTSLSVHIVPSPLVKRIESEKKEKPPPKPMHTVSVTVKEIKISPPKVFRSVNPRTQNLLLGKPSIKKPIVPSKFRKRI